MLLFGRGFAIVRSCRRWMLYLVTNSQIARLEEYLEQGGILVDGKLKPKADADLNLRVETTSI